MQKRITSGPWHPDQTALLALWTRLWVDEHHHLYLLLDLVFELDLSAILIFA